MFLGTRFSAYFLVDPDVVSLGHQAYAAVAEYNDNNPAPPGVLILCHLITTCVTECEAYDAVDGINEATGTPTIRFVPSEKYRALVERLRAAV